MKNRSLNDGFSDKVSARALIGLIFGFGSFAQLGTRPQRIDERVVIFLFLVITGLFCPGETLYLDGIVSNSVDSVSSNFFFDTFPVEYLPHMTIGSLTCNDWRENKIVAEMMNFYGETLNFILKFFLWPLTTIGSGR